MNEVIYVTGIMNTIDKLTAYFYPPPKEQIKTKQNKKGK